MSGEENKIMVADLRLSIYLRALHPEFFTIRARKGFSHGPVEADVWLLDVGHVITFIDGPNAVTEVIAPRDLELPPRGLIRAHDLVGEREHSLEARGPIIYRMAYQVDAELHETYLKEAVELLASAQQGHLLAETPREAARRPFSYAVPEARGTGVLVHTWHGFPAESTILKTQTLIERVE